MVKIQRLFAKTNLKIQVCQLQVTLKEPAHSRCWLFQKFHSNKSHDNLVTQLSQQIFPNKAWINAVWEQSIRLLYFSVQMWYLQKALIYVPQTEPFQNDISCKYNGCMAYNCTITTALEFRTQFQERFWCLEKAFNWPAVPVNTHNFCVFKWSIRAQKIEAFTFLFRQ